MKTRIKAVHFEDGKTIYYPLYKGWFIWHHFGGYIYDSFIETSFDNIEQAKAFIDARLAENQKPPKRRVQFIDYPVKG